MCRINEQIVGFADAFVDMPKWNDVCKIGLGKVSMYPILCLHDPRISVRGIFFVPQPPSGVTGTRDQSGVTNAGPTESRTRERETGESG